MWGIKKWPGRILQGALAGAQVINATGLGGMFPPLGAAAFLIGATQVAVSVLQHKSTEEGKPNETVLDSDIHSPEPAESGGLPPLEGRKLDRRRR